jgi:hypothetical protein
LKNALANYSAGVAVVNSEVGGLNPDVDDVENGATKQAVKFNRPLSRVTRRVCEKIAQNVGQSIFVKLNAET